MTEKSHAREKLEARAAELDLKVPANIGDDKLAERISKAEAKAASGSKPPEAKPKAGRLTVIGPKAGFWRAGIRWTAEPQTFGPGDLTDAQIKAIKAEPKLTVTDTE